MMNRFFRTAVILAVVAVIAVGTLSLAGKGNPKPWLEEKCPRDIYCLDVWDPVICADGEVYSNMCYAYRECAPQPCVPWGDDPYIIKM
jgi:hypothetical protein